MSRPRQSPYIPRRLLVEAPMHLAEPPVPAALLPVLAVLARAKGEAEIRAALEGVSVALQAPLVAHLAGRAQYRHAMATVLRTIPRERLAPLGAVRLSALCKAHL